MVFTQSMSKLQLKTHGWPIPADSGRGAVQPQRRHSGSGWHLGSRTLRGRRVPELRLQPKHKPPHCNQTAPQPEPRERKSSGMGQPQASNCNVDIPSVSPTFCLAKTSAINIWGGGKSMNN